MPSSFLRALTRRSDLSSTADRLQCFDHENNILDLTLDSNIKHRTNRKGIKRPNTKGLKALHCVSVCNSSGPLASCVVSWAEVPEAHRSVVLTCSRNESIAMAFAPSSVLAPSSDGLQPTSTNRSDIGFDHHQHRRGRAWNWYLRQSRRRSLSRTVLEIREMKCVK